MSTLEAIIDGWALSRALSQPTAHRLKEWLSSEGFSLDVEPAAHVYTITDAHLKDGGFNRLFDCKAILTALRAQAGKPFCPTLRVGPICSLL